MDLGHVHLRAGDADRTRAFYTDLLGLDVVVDMRGLFNPNWGREGDAIFFGAGGYHHHVGTNTWTSADGPRQAVPGAGLHHIGLLLPTRAALGAVVARLLTAGVEVAAVETADRAPTAWVEDPDGIRVVLAAEPDAPAAPCWVPARDQRIDPEALAAAARPAERSPVQGDVPSVHEAKAPIDPRTRCGHAHLRAADLDQTRRFYVDTLGWRVLEEDRDSSDPLTGDPGGLLRLSADGRHEVLAFNDWHSAGHPRSADGRTGLHHIAIRYPNRASLGDAVRRLRAAGYPEPPAATDADTHLAVYYDDPDGNTVELHHDHPRERWRDPYSAPTLTTVSLDELVASADREVAAAAAG